MAEERTLTLDGEVVAAADICTCCLARRAFEVVIETAEGSYGYAAHVEAIRRAVPIMHELERRDPNWPQTYDKLLDEVYDQVVPD
jgi:hypothetical protein